MRGFIVALVLLSLVMVGCDVLTTGSIISPSDCNGDANCLACVNKAHYCSGDYEKAYAWANNACGAVNYNYCQNGCSAGACIGGTTTGCQDDSDCTGTDVCNIATGVCMSKCDLLESGGVYTNCVEETYGACTSDDRYYCAQGYLLSAYNPTTGSNPLFCYLNGNYHAPSVTTCPNGCINGLCAEQLCMPNTEWCVNGDVYKCSADGLTESKIDTCLSTESCVELTSTVAQCQATTQWYCYDTNSWQCTVHSTKVSNTRCFATASDCQSNVPVCGDNDCTGAEDLTTCAQDCSVCGDDKCTWTEDSSNCPADCSVATNASCKIEGDVFNAEGKLSGSFLGVEYKDAPIDATVFGNLANTIPSWIFDYRDDKDTACCASLDPIFEDSASLSGGSLGINVILEYEKYTCGKKSAFCPELILRLGSAFSILDDYLDDNCQKGWAGIGIILFILLLIGWLRK